MYTKGEWEVVKILQPGSVTVRCEGHVVASVNEEANARLIAQAPRLYEACVVALAERTNIGDKPFWTPGVKEKLQQAIAEVEKKLW